MNKMLSRIVFGLLVASSSVVFGQDDLKYDEAVAKAEKENKPLVVLIGSDWCPNCVVMKRDIIVPMCKDGDFKDVVVVTINVDKESDSVVNKLLIVDKSTNEPIRQFPQLVVLCKKRGEWKKYHYDVGSQNKPRILELLKKVFSK